MARIESALLNLGALNELAQRKTAVHRLDTRAKLLTAAVFIVAVTSFNKYQLSGLLPFVFYPIALISAADIPLRRIFYPLLMAAPFAFFIGIFNPFFDREILVHLGAWSISGGWISFISILLRFILTVSAALLLIATCGFESICAALIQWRVPRLFVVQLLFMYRYLFVLTGEAMRMARAYALRSPNEKRIRLKVFGSLAGQLLLRTYDRAYRIHMAMLSRGFTGEIHSGRPSHFGFAEIVYMVCWISFFIIARSYNLPQLLGNVVVGL